MTTTMPLTDFIAELPTTQHKSLPWRRTRINPCSCIMQCAKCKEYLPIDKFYVLSKGKARRDILNNRLFAGKLKDIWRTNGASLQTYPLATHTK